MIEGYIHVVRRSCVSFLLLFGSFGREHCVVVCIERLNTIR